jgi:glycosyltransferase involved in cell wall biosynthesis
MEIIYHATAPPPAVEGTDAVFQEIAALRRRFGGEVNTLYPLAHGTYLPWRLFGLHQVAKLWGMDRRAALHHVFCSHLWPFPVMRLWRKPVVYTVVAGLNPDRPPKGKFPPGVRLVVASERDAETARRWGLPAPAVVIPAVDVARFCRAAPPGGEEFTLLSGSAPWGEEQFVTKGVEALLEAARRLPQLRLILLWRGVLSGRVEERVRRLGLQGRVEVVDRRADVNRELGRAHAAVVLAAEAGLVKAWPHSLIESLAAGRPVVVSRCIPMADFVARRDCGVVAETLDADAVTAAVRRLMAAYADKRRNALGVDRSYFRPERMLGDYGAIYESLCGRSRGRR